MRGLFAEKATLHALTPPPPPHTHTQTHSHTHTLPPASLRQIPRPPMYREFYWLKDFINFFIHNGGIDAIVRRFDSDKPLTGEALSLMLKPVSHFHKHLTHEGKLAFEPVRTRTLEYIKNLNLAELPSREYEAVSETLSVVKNLATTPEAAAEIDTYRMALAVELLENSTFNGKMNGARAHLLYHRCAHTCRARIIALPA
jgi:hypothetical protein